MKKNERLLFLTLLILTVIVSCLIAINQLNLITGILFLTAVCVLVFLIAETVMRILHLYHEYKDSNNLNTIRKVYQLKMLEEWFG